jgi:hypothetical protein
MIALKEYFILEWYYVLAGVARLFSKTEAKITFQNERYVISKAMQLSPKGTSSGA